MRSFSLTGAALLLALAAAPASADTLEMQQTGPTTTAPASMNFPTRGMHMTQVEKEYGMAQSVEPPVGDPPITRWEYAGYTVYFEGSFVIQSVVKR